MHEREHKELSSESKLFFALNIGKELPGGGDSSRRLLFGSMVSPRTS